MTTLNQVETVASKFKNPFTTEALAKKLKVSVESTRALLANRNRKGRISCITSEGTGKWSYLTLGNLYKPGSATGQLPNMHLRLITDQEFELLQKIRIGEKALVKENRDC